VLVKQCNIRALIDNNRESIIALMKEENSSKKYFAGLNLPPDQIIDMVVKDYLETIVLCYETGSLSTFQEKLNWFYPMYQSRKGEDHPFENNSDFFRILRTTLLTRCGSPDRKLTETLDQMEALIVRCESGESQ
jgi:hypothetical protein